MYALHFAQMTSKYINKYKIKNKKNQLDQTGPSTICTLHITTDHLKDIELIEDSSKFHWFTNN